MLNRGQRWRITNAAPQCKHPNREWAKLIHGETICIRKWCPTCGHIFKNTRKIRETDTNLVMIDSNLSQRWRKKAITTQKQLLSKFNQQQQYKPKFSKPITDFYKKLQTRLRRPSWKKLRQTILERDKYLCQRCKKTKARDVHHLTYDRLGHELQSDLMSVCRPCHRKIHRK